MLLFPFLAWLPIVASTVTFVLLLLHGDLNARAGSVLAIWFVAAAWAQFFAASASVGAGGLALQSLLAVFLIVRWRLAGQI